MIINLPPGKIECIIEICTKLCSKSECKLQELASVIGNLVSVIPAVQYGQLYYRKLEVAKIIGLRHRYGHFQGTVPVTNLMKSELNWWTHNIKQQSKQINMGNHDIILTTDASGSGWGAHLEHACTSGTWSEKELNYHSNILELLAIFYGLQAPCKHVENNHIITNTTSISHIKHMGHGWH